MSSNIKPPYGISTPQNSFSKASDYPLFTDTFVDGISVTATTTLENNLLDTQKYNELLKERKDGEWVVINELAPKTHGMKDLEGKLRFDLIPPEVDKALAEVLTIGAKKYADRNWEKGLFLVKEHLGAMKRHINKWESGEDLNKEVDLKGNPISELNHLKHALWHLMAMVVQIERGRTDLDDRSKK